MRTQKIERPHLEISLVDRVLSDIRRRGLSPGERYLTTEEISRMLGVRKAVANRALRQLADQRILVRRQRSGTFVGPAFDKPVSSRVHVVYVLLPKSNPIIDYWAVGPFTRGILSEFTDVNVQFSFVPERSPVEYVSELLEPVQGAGQLAGVIPVSSTPDVYQYLGEMRVPVVVFGSMYADPSPIHSVDVDNRGAGRLLTQYLVDRGHERMALMAVSNRRRGENDFYDSVSEVLAAAGLPHTALIHRLLPSDRESCEVVFAEMMRLPEPPTAIIARGPVIAHWMHQAATKIKVRVPENLELVLDDIGQAVPGFNVSAHPHVEPTLSFEEIAGIIGKRLKELAGDNTLPSEHIEIPFEFHVPVHSGSEESH